MGNPVSTASDSNLLWTDTVDFALFTHLMDADEREICYYLKSWHGQFISGKEIARRAGGKSSYRNHPDWAVQPLARLVERSIVESDATGHYRLLSQPKKKGTKWLSPQFQKILKQSGKDFGETVELEDPEDLFDR